MSTTIGTAYVQILPSTEGISSALSEAMNGPAESAGAAAGQKAGSGFGSKLASAAKVGAAAVAAVGTAAAGAVSALVSSAGAVAAYGDQIDKSSQQLGISAEAYQEWDAVLQHSGTSMDAMGATFKKLANAAQDASDDQIAAFQAIGLSMDEVKSMSAEDLFASVITGLQGMEEGTERTALATDLLGRGAQELGALLNTSAEDTQKMRDRVHELGGVMSDEAVKAAAAYQDSMQDMQTAISGLKNNLLADFLPSLTSVTTGLSYIFSGESGGAAIVSRGIEGLVNSISEHIPQVVELGSEILKALVTAITNNLPTLLSAGVEIINTLVDVIIQNLPTIVEAGLGIILQLATSIADSLPELIPTIVDVVLQIVDTLTDPGTLGALVDASIAIIIALANGLIDALPKLLEKAPEIIENLVTAIVENVPKLLRAAAEIIIKLVQGIIDNFPKIIESGKNIIEKLLEGIRNLFTNLLNVGKEIVDKVKDGFKQKIDDALNWGRDLINNFIDGIKNGWNGLKSAVSNVASGIASHLHFSEPDEGPLSNFHTYAPDMMKLFAKGVTDNQDLVTGAVERAFNFSDVLASPRLAPQLSMAGGPAASEGSVAELRALRDDLRGMLDAMRGLRVVLDTGETVGALSGPINGSLGQQYKYDRRGI